MAQTINRETRHSGESRITVSGHKLEPCASANTENATAGLMATIGTSDAIRQPPAQVYANHPLQDEIQKHARHYDEAYSLHHLQRPDAGAAAGKSGSAVDWIDPANLFRPLDRLDVEIDDDRLVVAAHQYAFERLVGRGIDLLVRHIRRHEDEIAGAGFGDVFEPLAPAHPRPPLEDINDALEMAVMMRAGLCIWVDLDRAGPDLLRADSREIDCRGAIHSGGLRGIRVELVARDHLDPVGFPIDVAVLFAHLDLAARVETAADMVSP